MGIWCFSKRVLKLEGSSEILRFSASRILFVFFSSSETTKGTDFREKKRFPNFFLSVNVFMRGRGTLRASMFLDSRSSEGWGNVCGGEIGPVLG